MPIFMLVIMGMGGMLRLDMRFIVIVRNHLDVHGTRKGVDADAQRQKQA